MKNFGINFYTIQKKSGGSNSVHYSTLTPLLNKRQTYLKVNIDWNPKFVEMGVLLSTVGTQNFKETNQNNCKSRFKTPAGERFLNGEKIHKNIWFLAKKKKLRKKPERRRSRFLRKEGSSLTWLALKSRSGKKKGKKICKKKLRRIFFSVWQIFSCWKGVTLRPQKQQQPLKNAFFD